MRDEKAYFGRVARNGDTGDGRLKSKSDNVGRKSCARSIHIVVFKAETLATSIPVMLRFSVEVLRAAFIPKAFI